MVSTTALARFLEPAIFGHVANTSAHEASRLQSICLALLLALVAFAFLCQGIDLSVVWFSPVVRRHCHACLMLCVVLQELKSHCCHRFEGSQILDLHIEGCAHETLYSQRGVWERIS